MEWEAGAEDGADQGGDREQAREDSPRQPYRSPKLTVLGTISDLTRGTQGQSDGIGPGSALGP